MLDDSLGLRQSASLSAGPRSCSDSEDACARACSAHPPNSPKRLRHRTLGLGWLRLAGETGQHGARKRCLVEGVLPGPGLPDVEHAEWQSIMRAQSATRISSGSWLPTGPISNTNLLT